MKKTLTAGLLLVALTAGALTTKEIQTVNIQSPAAVTIALPAGYDSVAADPYPVVYMLNGHGGNNRSWSTVINLDSLATVHRVIIVCPDGRNSWYWDSPVDSTMQMESYITEELVPWVDSHYHTRAYPEGRAITGLSMGGHGALWLGLRHPELFRNAGSTSGGVDIRPFPENWNMAKCLGKKADNPERWDEHTVMTLVEKVKPGQCNIIFDCGTDDFFYKVNCQLHDKMQRLGLRHIYLTRPGAHTPAYWNQSIRPQMIFFHDIFYPVE